MPPKKDKGKKGGPPKVDLKAAAGAPPKPKKIPPPPACFSPEDLAKFKEMFKLFDEDGIDKIKLGAVPTALRKLGFNPKNHEITQLFKLFLEDEYVDTVELHEFYFMIEAKMNWGDDFEIDVMRAMAALGHDEEDDKGETKNVCNIEILREELMTWGEPLTDIEFVDWPKLAIKDKTLIFETGIFAYTKFIENMNNKDALLRAIKEPINFFKLDQKTLAAMAIAKAQEEREEAAKKEAEKLAKEEARRQKMIADGLIQEPSAAPAPAPPSPPPPPPPPPPAEEPTPSTD